MTEAQNLTIEQLEQYENLVITQPNCPYCVKAKALLDERGTEYTTLVLGQELSKVVMVDFIEQKTGITVRTVPQIILDGKYIGGHDDLVAFLERQVETSEFDDFEL
ncbi:glutaredoxin domain-containing protein [Photobacterium lucens]|uniref:glutaredoxin domain-containing protein n=1 Tax=Photobacterium lucens TaxID=2562949 RepID=UPI00136BAF26|nr:glutaredoxin domain-containing protein [Photobacterium lucens]MBP2701572.1 glutaredoxin [Vibrio parahaemolyticus]MZG58106.1 glutaredoxin [Photobacterium lucens]MZG79494.1 glutaredoxin [Photobacterium lucens]